MGKTPVINVITCMPQCFPGVLGGGIAQKSLNNNLWKLNIINLHKYVNKNERLDDFVYGGGPGMLIKPEAVYLAMQNLPEGKNIYLTPRGKKLQQSFLREMSKKKSNLNILCGRYEGIDQRVIDKVGFEEFSIGEIVCMGGEAPASMLIEAYVRLLPEVLNNSLSIEEESFINNTIEHPQYTRPRVWREISVPSVLTSGNHDMIKQWKKKNCQKIEN